MATQKQPTKTTKKAQAAPKKKKKATMKAAATTKKTTTKTKKPMASSAAQTARVSQMPFSRVYPLYIQKVERKGRTKDDVDAVIAWLTGYRGAALQRLLDDNVSFGDFFAGATMNPNAALITGVVCGVRVEELQDPLMKKVRWLDKLVDELAQGRPLARVLRGA